MLPRQATLSAMDVKTCVVIMQHGSRALRILSSCVKRAGYPVLCSLSCRNILAAWIATEGFCRNMHRQVASADPHWFHPTAFSSKTAQVKGSSNLKIAAAHFAESCILSVHILLKGTVYSLCASIMVLTQTETRQ